MFVKSRGKSAKLDRPFDSTLLDRARQIAEQYRIILRQEDGEYYGQTLELPGAMNDGKSAAECIENTIDIATTTIATMLERRDEQVNVRLSKIERLTFEEAARSRGFRGLSDFLRNAAMSSVVSSSKRRK
jgi:predicted RNase H-like HicB family nuclease